MKYFYHVPKYFPSSDLVETGRVFGNGPYQVWEDVYDLIIRDYVSDVYVDVMETFIGASIKVTR